VADGTRTQEDNGGVNQVWAYDGRGSSWTAITGTNTTVSQMLIAGNSPWMVASNGSFYQKWQYRSSGMDWMTA
jgi:hypothetical protein